MTTNEVSRRGFLAAAGTATAAGASASVAAQESPTATSGGGNGTDGGGGSGGGGGGGKQVPVFGSYLSDARLYEQAGTVDARDQDSISVSVGAGGEGVAFDPPTIWVSPGTTITWEWTGEGGAHNVAAEEGPAEFDSGSAVDSGDETYEYEVTEDDAGITTYKCVPHESLGMKGGVAVGDDVETTTVDTGGGAGGPSVTIPDQALALTVATFIAMTTTLGLGYFFMKYGGNAETTQ